MRWWFDREQALDAGCCDDMSKRPFSTGSAPADPANSVKARWSKARRRSSRFGARRDGPNWNYPMGSSVNQRNSPESAERENVKFSAL